jgi:Tfp pilus assembly protein PilF
MLLLLGIVSEAFWSRWLLADHQAAVANLARDFPTKVAAVQAAVDLNAFNSYYRSLAGTIHKDAFVQALGRASEAAAAGRNANRYNDAARRALRDAEQAMLDAIAHTPDEYDSHVALASLYNLAGNTWSEAAYFGKAIDAASKATQLSRFGVAARYELAWAYAQTGRRLLAVAELEYAHALDPAYVDCALGLAMLYSKEFRYDDAATVLNRTLARRPGHGGLVEALDRIDVRRREQAGALTDR